MEWAANWFAQFVSETNNPVALLILAASSVVEYVFPPFPGDTITLFGAVLITGYGWSFIAVFGSVMLGSVVGTMMAYYFGHRLRISRRRRAKEDPKSIVNRLVAKFKKYGAAYLILNRFFPGIRSLFFVAAGLASMRPLPVLLYATLSAALWNLGLILLGSALGANLDTLSAWVSRYTIVMWIVIATVIVLLVLRSVLRRRSSSS